VGVARFRPARIDLLDGSLYTWLGAKALSQMRRPGALRMNTIVIAWLSFDDNQTPLDQAEVNYSHMT
jgi:hypothetical protein